jgi:hypothetical protein
MLNWFMWLSGLNDTKFDDNGISVAVTVDSVWAAGNGSISSSWGKWLTYMLHTEGKLQQGVT